MKSMSDVEFARTVHIDANHPIHSNSLFIWTSGGVSIEVDKHEFRAILNSEFNALAVALPITNLT